MSEPESQSDGDNVICPHCLYVYQAEAEDYNEDEREIECSYCTQSFLLRDEISVTHYTRPLQPKASQTS